MKYLLIVSLFLFYSCQHSLSPQAEFFTERNFKTLEAQSSNSFGVVLLSNLQAQVMPCNCSFTPNGGIERISKFVSSERRKAKDILVLNSGNSILGKFFNEPVSTSDKKKMGDFLLGKTFDAVNVGSFDLDERFLDSLGNTTAHSLLSANLVDSRGKIVLPAFKDFKRGDQTIRVVGLSSSGLPPLASSRFSFSDPILAFQKIVESDDSSGKQIVILSDLTNDDLLKLLRGHPERAVLVLGSREPSEKFRAIQYESSLWYLGRDLGKSVLSLSLDYASQNRLLLDLSLWGDLQFKVTQKDSLYEPEANFVDQLKVENLSSISTVKPRVTVMSRAWD